MVDVNDYKETVEETVVVERTVFRPSKEVDNYLENKIRAFFDERGYETTDGTYQVYVYNDREDWVSIREIYEGYQPENAEELKDISYGLNTEGLSDAILNLENALLGEIQSDCLTKDEMNYIEEAHDLWTFMNNIFYVKYDFEGIFDELKDND